MIKRSIVISEGEAYVHVKDAQLVVKRGGHEVASAPLEDIGILLIENAQITCSANSLAALAEAGAAVLFCDRQHQPVGLLQALAGHHLHTGRLRDQIALKKTLQKQLWQQVVQSKLANQAAALPPDAPGRERLQRLVRSVRSNDSANCEAQGARVYWPALLGKEFRRDQEGEGPNALLNYGYAGLRAALARAICSAGLHPALGLKHSSQSNAFVLADDLMEPFRPFVDVKVLDLVRQGVTNLTKDTKANLLECLSEPVWIRGVTSPLLVAAQKCADSFVHCLRGDAARLDLPSLAEHDHKWLSSDVGDGTL